MATPPAPLRSPSDLASAKLRDRVRSRTGPRNHASLAFSMPSSDVRGSVRLERDPPGRGQGRSIAARPGLTGASDQGIVVDHVPCSLVHADMPAIATLAL
jgi:hypothetical protein